MGSLKASVSCVLISVLSYAVVAWGQPPHYTIVPSGQTCWWKTSCEFSALVASTSQDILPGIGGKDTQFVVPGGGILRIGQGQAPVPSPADAYGIDIRDELGGVSKLDFCTQRQLVLLLKQVAQHLEKSTDIVHVYPIFVPPATGLRQAAKEIEAKDALIDRMRETIRTCAAPE